jgi:hypothetical protein
VLSRVIICFAVICFAVGEARRPWRGGSDARRRLTLLFVCPCHAALSLSRKITDPKIIGFEVPYRTGSCR